MAYLESTGIPHERLIVPGVPHSATKIYEQKGLAIMQFQAANLAKKDSVLTE